MDFVGERVGDGQRWRPAVEGVALASLARGCAAFTGSRSSTLGSYLLRPTSRAQQTKSTAFLLSVLVVKSVRESCSLHATYEQTSLSRVLLT